jgi:hypothetical protein
MIVRPIVRSVFLRINDKFRDFDGNSERHYANSGGQFIAPINFVTRASPDVWMSAN